MEELWESYVPNKPLIIFDLEADSLLPNKIHCLSYCKFDWWSSPSIKTLTSIEEIKELFSNDYIFCGHNIILWDIPKAVERLCNIEVTQKVVDSLWLSRYIFPNESGYGLEEFGVKLGIEKPKILDWENLTLEEYIHRCEEDVKINFYLFRKIFEKFNKIYEDPKSIWRFIWYLMFKVDCIKEQEVSKWKLDLEKAQFYYMDLELAQENILEQLKEVMPKVPKMSTKSSPKRFYNKEGELTKLAISWLEFLKEQGLPEDEVGPVEYIKDYDDPNPNSSEQVKSWLSSLGWEPITFNYVKDSKTGETRKIPQIRVEENNEKVLCESVKKLIDKAPDVELLESLSTLNHRIGIFKGFIKDVEEDNYITASASGITNTLRLRHKTIVNLPSIDKPYGKEVRSCLIAPEGYELCGADLSALENKTRDIFIMKYDPEYVKAMSDESFDSHIDIAVIAKIMSQEDADFYLDYSKRDVVSDSEKKKLKELKSIRQIAKFINYSSVYGIGVNKLSLTLGISKEEASNLLEAYWKRNWSVIEFSKSCKKFTYKRDEMWVFNPLSKFWYSLRYEKDVFSTVNQSAGSFIFDSWLKRIRIKRPQLTGQMHDELILCIPKNDREECKNLVISALEEVNQLLSLPVPMSCDVQFGKDYSCIH